ncbi:MAG: LLM class F420-dependent oxidoreductase [Dehalococcoidia bacterium]|nr:LLM class F420-dependent oxidoreductase [Dehalococcoidia bacterium]MCB9484750.1 LLM class F420-dependent oxidoreductase [Thermoflexaceae bacterium]
MKIGVVFPQTEIGADPAVIRDFAQAAEALGYTHLLAYDHVLGAVHQGREPRLTGPYTEETPFHEPFVLFGYLAGLTTTIELVTGVLILPQRQTALVAKQAAQVAVLSGGRLRLGVGVGWNYVEYDALGEDFHTRGRRQAEQIEVLRKLWTEPVVDYTGKYHRVDRAGVLPMPAKQIPIWMGGGSDAAYRRAAAMADGFIFTSRGGSTESALKLREMVAAAGREQSSFGIEGIVPYQSGPDSWGAQVESWRAVGATHLSVVAMNAGLDPKGHIAMLETYRKAIG